MLSNKPSLKHFQTNRCVKNFIVEKFLERVKPIVLNGPQSLNEAVTEIKDWE